MMHKYVNNCGIFLPSVAAESCRSGETGADNMSIWSGELEADEGLEMSQQMMDSLLLGAEPQLRNEEYLTGVSSRLQAAVEKMLMTITGTTGQVGNMLFFFFSDKPYLSLLF